VMMRRFGSLCEFCSLPSFLLDNNGSGRGGAHTSKGRTGEADKHYTVRGFGKDGHVRYTFHIPSESEDGAVPSPNGGDWQARKYLDVSKRCIDLKESLVNISGGGLDGQTEQKILPEWLERIKRWIK
jgi:hypothetical protein